MTLTTGDEQPDQGVSGEPLEMRRGPNYGQPGQGYGQPRYGPPAGDWPAGYGQYGGPPRRRSRAPLLLLIGALALTVAIIVLLLNL
jgi:hypothetical protein